VPRRDPESIARRLERLRIQQKEQEEAENVGGSSSDDDDGEAGGFGAGKKTTAGHGKGGGGLSMGGAGGRLGGESLTTFNRRQSIAAKGAGGYASQGQSAMARLIRGLRKTDESAEPPPVAFYERGPDSAVMVRVSPDGEGEAYQGEKPSIDSLGGDDYYEEVDMRGVFAIRLRHGRGVSRAAATKAIYAGRWWCGKKSGRGVELDAHGMYAGAFKLGTRWGLGTLRTALGDAYTGRFGPPRRALARAARERLRI